MHIRNIVEKVVSSFVPPQQPSPQSTLLGYDSHNKPIAPLANKVPLEQDANSTKEFRASYPSSNPKGQTLENEPPKVTIEVIATKANAVVFKDQRSDKNDTKKSNLDKGIAIFKQM
ncbi:hypothetical protein V8G54_006646 [Vigna mungo]|uniref:Uncharacterized protein n=1 Tax=Vigna mungo TaxID=3915 RepID=A0AAQ3S8A3_VIGMU